MTNETKTPTHLQLRKSNADRRYYVAVDGIRVGWVSKGHEGWTMWATTETGAKATIVATGSKTRTACLWDGLGHLRIHNLGRVFGMNENYDEVAQYVTESTLRAIESDLLAQMHPS